MSKLTDGYINWLRISSRQDNKPPPTAQGAATPDQHQQFVTCRLCEASVVQELSAFRQHYAAEHGEGSLSSKAIEDEFRELSIKPPTPDQMHAETTNSGSQTQTSPNKKRPVSGATGEDDPETTGMAEGDRGSKKLCSPPAPDVPPTRPSPRTTQQNPARSRARQSEPANDFDRGRGSRPSRPLFDYQHEGAQKASGQSSQPPSKQHTRKQATTATPPQRAGTTEFTSQAFDFNIDPDHPHTSMQPQPKTKPISQEQLVAEVKGIYAGLVMIEGKCIEVDNAQSHQDYNDLKGEQWTALVSLHRTLLHEHHDFFLASQHPSANVALRRLASKYAMPARMWRHGIHSFLEVLRHKLPHSYDHMLAFIYTAYSMMALLYETVPAFEDTWIECLGDLARYRMAIEEHDLKDREIWTGVARHWYSCASDKAPETGRLYHHLAILARPNAIQQLCYYTKSLCVPIPFSSARESIMTLFEPILNSPASRLSAIDTAFVKTHGILFSGKYTDQLDASMHEYLNLLDAHIGRVTKRWLEIGYNTAIPLACSLLGYGAETHFLVKILSRRSGEDQSPDEEPDETFKTARTFAMKIYEIVVQRWGDHNTLPFLNTFLVFIYHVSRHPAAMVHLEEQFPWHLTCIMLNYLTHTCNLEPRADTESFPGAQKNDSPRPLPEDFKIRGLKYVENVFPPNWFKDSQVEEDEKQFELPSMIDQRKERILWLGRRLARTGTWLTWTPSTQKFSVAERFAAGVVDFSLEAVFSKEEQQEHK